MSIKPDLTELTALAQLAYAYVQLATPIKLDQIKKLKELAEARNNPNRKFKLTSDNKYLLKPKNLNSFKQLFCVLNKLYSIEHDNIKIYKHLFNISRTIIIANLNEFETEDDCQNQLDKFVKAGIYNLFETDIFVKNPNVESFNKNLTEYLKTSEFHKAVADAIQSKTPNSNGASTQLSTGDANNKPAAAAAAENKTAAVENKTAAVDFQTSKLLINNAVEESKTPNSNGASTQQSNSNETPSRPNAEAQPTQLSTGDANNTKLDTSHGNNKNQGKQLSCDREKIKKLKNRIANNSKPTTTTNMMLSKDNIINLNKQIEEIETQCRKELLEQKASKQGGNPSRKLKKVKSNRRSKSFQRKKSKRTRRINPRG